MNKYKITGDGKNVTVLASNMVTAIENLGYKVIRTIGRKPKYSIEVSSKSILSNNVILTPVTFLYCEWINS